MTPVVSGLADGYRRLGPDGGGACVRSSCALIWVEGPESASFLHGILTNDIAALGVGQATYALLLDAKGRIQADLSCVREGDEAFTLVTDPASGDSLTASLERLHVSESIEIFGPEPSELLIVGGVDIGARAAEAGAAIAIPGRVPGTTALVTDDAQVLIAALRLPEVPASALEARRIEAGVARVGVDTHPGSLVQEAALEGAAVSFSKGCYLGQETVARLSHRGHVNRLLRGLSLEGAAAIGAAVTAGDAEVGRVTSIADSPEHGTIALATIRTSVAPGDTVAVAGAGAAEVRELPFL